MCAESAGRLEKDMEQTDEKIVDRLEAALRRRRSLQNHTNALRLVDGPGDGLKGLILEQYADHFVAQIFHQRWFAHQEVLTDFIQRRCGGRYLIVKDRTQPVPAREAVRSEVWIEEDGPRTVVEENGLKFGVDLDDGLNSGLFLDMRRNRKIIAGLSKGKKILNCFAYTCSFGVYARVAGAGSVVNVDISRKSLSRGRANYELNGLTPSRNEFIRADALEYLKRAVEKDNRFDLIILDPPSFARHGGGAFSVKKDLERLTALAMNVLNPGGFLFAATNLSSASYEDLERMVRAAALKQAVKKIQRLGPDEDFTGSGLVPESSLTAVLARI